MFCMLVRETKWLISDSLLNVYFILFSTIYIIASAICSFFRHIA